MKIKCHICPKTCSLEENEIGDCHARINKNNVVTSLAYSKPCSLSIDPMEKKPLFHFFPATPILSLGMAGCNLHCKNCQNSSISQVSASELDFMYLPPENLAQIMQANNTKSVAYTYTEPLVAYEYVLDSARLVHEAGMYNVLVTAAYINPKPLKALLPFIDAANVDLKSMSEDFYQDNCSITLKPVLKALKIFKESDTILEVTNLVIPTLNDSEDDFKRLIDFVLNELGDTVPLHFSRFFPTYKRENLLPTPLATLSKAFSIAKELGLKYIYVGNTPQESSNTLCPACHEELIVRRGYEVEKNSLSEAGLCPVCQSKIYGRF